MINKDKRKKVETNQVFSLFDQGISQSDIATSLGISRQRVFQILKDKEKYIVIEEKRRDKEKIKQKMLYLKNQGFTYQEIAKELSVSIAWVSNVLREFSPKKDAQKKEYLARFMACCCCGSSWVEDTKETASTNCPACFSSCREIQKIYDRESLETLRKYAQKMYLES